MDIKCVIITPVIALSCQLHIDWFELLLDRSSRVVQICVDIFDVDNDEFWEAVSIKKRFERVLPVRDHVNFKCLHRLNIDNMDEFRNLVDEYKRADAS